MSHSSGYCSAVLIDDFALLVHDVIVFEQLFADLEVVRFDLLLRVCDGARDHPVLDRNAFLHPQLEHELGDAFGREDSHQIVFK